MTRFVAWVCVLGVLASVVCAFTCPRGFLTGLFSVYAVGFAIVGCSLFSLAREGY